MVRRTSAVVPTTRRDRVVPDSNCEARCYVINLIFPNPGDHMPLRIKKELSKVLLHECGSMLVSYSGGVDSTLLAVLARDILGDRSRSVFLDSPLVPRAAVADAKKIADDLGITLDIIEVPHMDYENFRKNPPERCYYCKKISAVHLKETAKKYDLAFIADGINVSDLGEHRPGLTAATEEGIIHPFILAGITKEEIRQIARDYGLAVWQKPSAACLSSRVPYGDEITLNNLRMIEEAEVFLAGQGFTQFRVRLHGRVARIEVLPADFGKVLTIREDILHRFREIGISYAALDLAGYRSGSMDEIL